MLAGIDKAHVQISSSGSIDLRVSLLSKESADTLDSPVTDQ
ncbi:15932_t:CDS:1, partial [Acaulospora colombiana]